MILTLAVVAFYLVIIFGVVWPLCQAADGYTPPVEHEEGRKVA